jgi:site-specific DNA-cytosine methylase
MLGKVRKKAGAAAAKKAKAWRRNGLTCVDLFAGAGGFSLAADRAGFSVKLAVEHDKHACATYRHNFRRRGAELKEGDITLMSPRKLAGELFEADEFCDLLLGGPPCQGFSAHRLNDAGVEDPRNHLIHTYFDFVKAFEPSLFLMENVPGMLWSRHADFLEEFYRKAKSSGYDVRDPVVIDARDHGLPIGARPSRHSRRKNSPGCSLWWTSVTKLSTSRCHRCWIRLPAMNSPSPCS